MNNVPERIYLINVTSFESSTCGTWDSKKDTVFNIEYVYKNTVDKKIKELEALVEALYGHYQLSITKYDCIENNKIIKQLKKEFKNG